MRILSILASPAPGGAEILVRNLSREFVAAGHASHVVFLSDAAGVGNPVEFGAELLASLDAAGATHAILPAGSFGNALKAGRSIAREVRRFAPDLVHVHLARGLLALRFSGVRLPTVFTQHNVVAKFPVPIFRLLDRRVDHYVAIGDACRAFLEARVAGPIVDIPNGVPAEFERAGPRTGFRRDPFILSVGSMTPQKDFPTLVEAAAAAASALSAQGRDPTFAIAGEGKERAAIEARISALGLGERFRLLGARRDIPQILQDSDLLVNSSIHEGLPLTLIEGAMSALPIVATDVGGNGEVVAHGNSGFIVPPRDPEALARRIVELLSDEESYRAFSAAALARSRNFTIAACAKAHLALYERVLREGGRARRR